MSNKTESVKIEQDSENSSAVTSNCEKQLTNILNFAIDDNFKIKIDSKYFKYLSSELLVATYRQGHFYAITGLNFTTMNESEVDKTESDNIRQLLHFYFVLVNLKATNNDTIYKTDLDNTINQLKSNYGINVTDENITANPNIELNKISKPDLDNYNKLINNLKNEYNNLKNEYNNFTPPQLVGGRPTNLHNLTKQKKYRRTRSKSCKRKNKKSII